MREIVIGAIGSILGAIIILLFQKAYFGWGKTPGIYKMLRFSKEFSLAGGINFFSSRKAYAKFKDHGTQKEYLSRANQSIVYVGFWLAHGVGIGDIISGIKKYLENDVKVTIVLIDPSSPVIKHSSLFLGQDTTEIISRINNAIENFSQLYSALSLEARKNFELRLHNIPLTASAFLLDHQNESARVLVDFKLYNHSRDDSFGIEVQGRQKDLTKRFIDSYLKVLENSTLYQFTK